MAFARSSFTYAAIQKPDEEVIRNRLRELAQVRRRFGYRRLHTMLQREGFTVNHKRILRLYRLENLSIRIRRRKKLTAVARVELLHATKPNQRWSMDFLQDALHDGRRIKAFPNENWFTGLDHARRIIEDWRVDYNSQRPHSSLNYMTPEEFLRQEMAQNETKNSRL